MDPLINILHLEDDPADAVLVKAKLVQAGLACRITLARTRDEFEKGLDNGGADIILADFQLPGYDGMSALRLAREQRPEIPFVFVSGKLGEKAAIEALTKGATDYVLKHDLSRLAPAVRRALQETRNQRKRKLADQQVALMSYAMNSIHEAVFMIDENACFQYVNDMACRLLGYTRDELLTMGPKDIHPDPSLENYLSHRKNLKAHGALIFEGEMKARDGRLLPVEINANYFEYEGHSYDLGLVRDITDRKKAECERLADLGFFECMDRANRAIQSADDIEEMMKNLLDLVLSIFDCDRAFLLYPCDPESPTWSSPMERNKPEYPGVLELKREIPMDPQVAETFRILLDADGPVKFGSGAQHALPEDVSKQFGIKSFMSMAVYPKTGRPWQFGIHQCSHEHVWMSEEERLFQEIGRRLEDGLTSMLVYRDLRESEAKYRQIVDTANEGIWVLGPDTLTSFVNARMAEMLGLSVEKMIGRPLTDFMYEEDLPDHELKMKNRRQGKPEYYERRFRHQNGQTVWTHASATPIFDAEHYYNGSFAMFADISENKRTQIRLNEQLLLLQQLLDSIPIPVYYKDTKGLYLGCNAAFEAFIDLPRKDIVGKTVHEVVPKQRADKHHEMDLALLSHPGVQAYEVSGTYKDGEHHNVIFHKATFIDANDRVAGTIGTLVDITERRRAKRERLANLRFFESMDRVNRAIQSAGNLEQMMKDVLDVVLSILDCERVNLMYPCDPEAETWAVPMERSKPGCEGFIFSQKLEIPMQPAMAGQLRVLMDADGPVTFGPGADHPLPEQAMEQDGFHSLITTALYPKVGKAWQFCIHQCSDARVWTSEEKVLVREIGRRLADALTSLLTLRDLRKNREFLDNIVEHIPNMIFVKDAQTLKILSFNKAGEELVGYPREELIGKTDHDFFPKEMADVILARDRQVIESKEPVGISEETIITRNNERRTLQTKKIPLLDEIGVVQYLLSISEDITTRIEAEQSIRKLSQAIEQSPVSIVITDVDGGIEFVNTEFTRVTGYGYDEVMGQRPSILKSGKTPDEVYKRLWQTIVSGGVWRGEFQNRKKNGELFWEQATIAPVRDGNNVITHYVAVKEDISERKKLEEQLRQTQKMEAVGQLAGGVAHDFNNMLGVIIGHAELALNKAELDDALRKNIQEILSAAFRSSDITRQLLAFARKQTIEPRILDLNETVEGMLKLLRRLIGEDIDLAWLPGTKLWPIKMDPSQIDQILANLCVNARDAIGGVGKVTIETNKVHFDDTYCTEHRGFCPGEYVILMVSDTGNGMDQATMEKIFEPFFTTKGVGKGTGLGLATIYGIVKQNKGFINVYSEPGSGSTFKIYLPRYAAPVSPEPEAVPEPQTLGGHETILVVEDEVLHLELVELMLESYGYQVMTASSPGKALLAAKRHTGKIHLLMTDLIMPEMNGRDLSKEMTSLYPDMKCLFMSGYTNDIIVHQGILEKGVHFIQKPFSMQHLALKVREILDAGRTVPP